MATKRYTTTKRPRIGDTSEITEEEIYFTDKTVFKDEMEHPYECVCYDGVAFCTKVPCKENINAPQNLMLGYPSMCSIKGTAKETACKEYRGIPMGEPLCYSDIAIKYGKIGKYGFTADELNIMDELARSAKMDWFVTTTEGNFKDGETGKPMTAKKALKDLVEGLTDDDFKTLDKDDLVIFIRSLASQL